MSERWTRGDRRRRRRQPVRASAVMIAVTTMVLATVLVGTGSRPASAAGPAGFQDSVVLGGLSEPTNVAFAADGRVFIAEKSGLIKVYHGLSDTSPAVFADLRTQVHNFWDRGLL